MRFSLGLAILDGAARHGVSGKYSGRGRLRGQGNAGILVLALSHRAVLEDPALANPLEGVLEDLLGVRLEYDALARAPAAGGEVLGGALGGQVAGVLGGKLGPHAGG